MSFPASDVYDMVRSLMNDQLAAVYTNTLLQPYLNIALRDLSSLLERANVPVSNATSVTYDIAAGVDNIGGNDPSDLALPEDLEEIQGLYQRQNENENFFLITRLEFLTALEEQPRTSYIPAWAWMGQVIRFIPANSDLQLKINYVANAVPTIDADATQIGIIGSLNYLGYRTGALASMYVGENETRALSLQKQADDEWDDIMGIATKGRQSISTRRRPFRSKSWGGNSLGW